LPCRLALSISNWSDVQQKKKNTVSHRIEVEDNRLGAHVITRVVGGGSTVVCRCWCGGVVCRQSEDWEQNKGVLGAMTDQGLLSAGVPDVGEERRGKSFQPDMLHAGGPSTLHYQKICFNCHQLTCRLIPYSYYYFTSKLIQKNFSCTFTVHNAQWLCIEVVLKCYLSKIQVTAEVKSK
jgi:hypothetical protein